MREKQTLIRPWMIGLLAIIAIPSIGWAIAASIRADGGLRFKANASAGTSGTAANPVVWSDATTLPNLRFSDGTADRYVQACSPTTNGDYCSWNGANWVRTAAPAGGGGGTGNWTFSGNIADLTGAGAMQLGNGTATSLKLLPTTLNFTSGASLAATAQGATNTTGLTITPNVVDGVSSIGLLVNNNTAFSSGADVVLQNAATEKMRLTSSSAYRLGSAVYGMYFSQATSVIASGGLWLATVGGTPIIVDAGGVYANADNAMTNGFNTRNWSSTWSYVYGTVKGTNIASASTISPTAGIHHITGTTQINTINPPVANFVGSITLIPDAAFTTGTSGNIAIASTAVVSKALIMTLDGTKWYPSY